MQRDRRLTNSRRLTAVLVTAVALALTIAVAPVQADTSDGTSWGDSSPLIEGGPLGSLVASLARMNLCLGVSIPTPPGAQMVAPPGGRTLALLTAPRVPSFAAAQRHALALVAKGKGTKGLAMLRRSKAAKSAELMLATSAGLALAGSPRGALAAMLLASSRDAADPGTLASIGGMLAKLGKPLDGLAYIAKSKTVRGPRPTLVGVKQGALVFANEGYALFKLKRYNEAIVPLRRAVAMSPSLAEANSTLGAALLCSGNTSGGVAALRAGARRERYKVIVRDPASGLSRPAAAELFDMRAFSLHTRTARPVALPSLQYAATADQLPALSAHYAKLTADTSAVSSAAAAAGDVARTRWQAGFKRKSKATQNRQNSMLFAAFGAHQEPQVVAAQRAVDSLDIQASSQKILTEFTAAHVAQIPKCSGPSAQACLRAWCIPAAIQTNGRYLALENAYDTAIRRLWAAEGRIILGVAAASADPNLQAYLRAHATGKAATLYKLLLGTATAWSGQITFLKAICTNTVPPPTNTDAAPHMELEEGCREVAGDNTLTVDLGGVSLGVNCDQVGVGISSEGIVGAFGKTEIGKDSSTFIIGARGGAFGNDWESGIGVKVGPKGIEDVFWRTGPALSAGAGPVSIAPSVSQVDISFVGTISYIPTAFGYGGPSVSPPGG